jgi:hypothetical protein
MCIDAEIQLGERITVNVRLLEPKWRPYSYDGLIIRYELGRGGVIKQKKKFYKIMQVEVKVVFLLLIFKGGADLSILSANCSTSLSHTVHSHIPTPNPTTL